MAKKLSPPAGYRACECCGGTGYQIDPHAFGQMMRDKRELAGVTLAQIGTEIQLTPPYLSDLERGNRSFNTELAEKYEAAIDKLRRK